MEPNNPYQAPTYNASSPAPSGTVLFSEEGVRVVESMATWMRFIGVLLLLGAGLGTLLMIFASLAGGAQGLLGVLVGLPLVVAVGASGVWLREAGSQFRRGMAADDEGTLGAAFGSLRKYLIVFGIFELLNIGLSMTGWVLQ